jgi:hypothetical protein
MTDTGATYTVSDIVRAYDITHGKLYRMIKNGLVPASEMVQEKYKGRKGWRHRLTAAAVASLNLSPRPVAVYVVSETSDAEPRIAAPVGFPVIAV